MRALRRQIPDLVGNALPAESALASPGVDRGEECGIVEVGERLPAIHRP